MAASTTAQQIIDVVTPAAGESVTEGTIPEWHVKVGDQVKADATIVEISTDKVDVELPSPATGTVTELLVQEGDTVTVGQVIARIAVGDAAPGASNGGAAPPAQERNAPEPEAEPQSRSSAAAEQADGGGATDAAAGPSAGEQPATGQLVDVVTPAAGASVSEGTTLEWRAGVGDFIKASDTIVEISTDKVDVELPAPASGTVAELLVQEGDTVTVGQVIARIAIGDGERAAGAPESADGVASAPAQTETSGSAATATSPPGATGATASATTPDGA